MDRIPISEIRALMNMGMFTLNFRDDKSLMWYDYERKADPSRWIVKVTGLESHAKEKEKMTKFML